MKLSAALDHRFGKKPIAGKLTDVPCHARGLVGPVADVGVRFLDIGVNGGCTSPEVPFISAPDGVPAQGLKETFDRSQDRFVSLMGKYGTDETTTRQLLRGAAVDPHAYLFNWRDPEGAELMLLYHPLRYGSTVAIPGTDFAVSVQVRGNNSGPHSLQEIKDSYASLHALFSGAQVVPTNLNVIAKALEPVRPGFPVVTKEMGDTWIYGVGSEDC